MWVNVVGQKKGCCDTSIEIDDSFGDISDFQTDENQNEWYVTWS